MYDFGPVAAQDDPNILSYFHVTDQVAGLVLPDATPHDFVFVARPGAGKTALVKWLQGAKQPRTILFIDPTRTRLVMQQQEANPEDYRIMMRAELFSAVVVEAIHRKVVKEQLGKDCRAFYQKQWFNRIKRQLSEKFEGLSILGYGFSLAPDESRQYLREIRSDGQVEIASELAARLARATPLTVVVDDPESIVGQGLEDVTPDNAKRIGALLSVLGQLHLLGIQVIVFMKEHILQMLQRQYRDYSQFGDRISGLEWTQDDLLKVVELRVQQRLHLRWSDVFTIGEKTFCSLAFPLLVNGPRDLLHVCNNAGKAGTRISKAILARNAHALRPAKWTDIANQYNAQWPAMDRFAKTTCEFIAKTFGTTATDPDKLRSAIAKEFQRSGSPLNALRDPQTWMYTALWETPSIEERLFIVGCLGYVRDGRTIYPWAGRSLEGFRLADKVLLSPLFA